MINIKEYINNFFSKIKKWQAITLSVIGLFTTIELVKPYVSNMILLFSNMYKSQKNYEKIEKDLKHNEEYQHVLNHIVDGVSETRYHRGIRYLVTVIEFETKKEWEEYWELSNIDKLKYDLVNRDWYYLTTDSDNKEKWLIAIYSAKHDTFSYIDHDGIQHYIIPKNESIIKK